MGEIGFVALLPCRASASLAAIHALRSPPSAGRSRKQTRELTSMTAPATGRLSRSRTRPWIAMSSARRRSVTALSVLCAETSAQSGPMPSAAATTVTPMSRSARGTGMAKRPSPSATACSGFFASLSMAGINHARWAGKHTLTLAPAAGLPSGSRTRPRKTILASSSAAGLSLAGLSARVGDLAAAVGGGGAASAVFFSRASRPAPAIPRLKIRAKSMALVSMVWVTPRVSAATCADTTLLNSIPAACETAARTVEATSVPEVRATPVPAVSAVAASTADKLTPRRPSAV